MFVKLLSWVRCLIKSLAGFDVIVQWLIFFIWLLDYFILLLNQILYLYITEDTWHYKCSRKMLSVLVTTENFESTLADYVTCAVTLWTLFCGLCDSILVFDLQAVHPSASNHVLYTSRVSSNPTICTFGLLLVTSLWRVHIHIKHPLFFPHN